MNAEDHASLLLDRAAKTKRMWELGHECDRLQRELDAARASLAQTQNRQAHCESCGCSWLDDGINVPQCPYCDLQAARANERLTESHKSLLHDLAYIAHDGGLVSMSEHDALVAVRRLTLPYWCRVAAQNERIAFIRAAIAAQEGK